MDQLVFYFTLREPSVGRAHITTLIPFALHVANFIDTLNSVVEEKDGPRRIEQEQIRGIFARNFPQSWCGFLYHRLHLFFFVCSSFSSFTSRRTIRGCRVQAEGTTFCFVGISSIIFVFLVLMLSICVHSLPNTCYISVCFAHVFSVPSKNILSYWTRIFLFSFQAIRRWLTLLLYLTRDLSLSLETRAILSFSLPLISLFFLCSHLFLLFYSWFFLGGTIHCVLPQ